MTAPMVSVPVDTLRAIYGMAREGCEAPMAAYRWCERIDEVFHGLDDEYAEYARDLPERFAAAPTPQPVQGEYHLEYVSADQVRLTPITHPPAPAVGGGAHFKDELLRQQSEAWQAVVAVLNDVSPDWCGGDGSGIDLACAAIRKLATPAVQIAAPGDVERLQRAYWLGWRNSAAWADRKDLWADRDSKAYTQERDDDLGSLAAALRSQGQAVASGDVGREAWTLADRIEFALRDAGFTEADAAKYTAAALRSHGQAAMRRWLQANKEQP